MAKRKVSSKKVEDLDVEIEEVEASASAAPIWEHPNFWFYLIGGLAILFSLWYGYKEFIAKPNQKEAEEAIWQAQMQFDRDSFDLALNNPGGGSDGLLAIIDSYGSTPTGNTARLYAGLSYLNIGDFDNAIQYLEDYDATDAIFATSKYLGLGDAYSEKEDLGKAASMYEKAANAGENELMNAYAFKKLGMLHLVQGNKEAALKAFLKIKYDFPSAPVASDVDKYIAEAGGEQ